MGKNLYNKVWDAHTVGTLADGRTQLFIGTHLIHEVTSPQAFGMLRDLGLGVKFPNRTFATVDHIVPTDNQQRPFADPLADAMIRELRKNVDEFGIKYFDLTSGMQGIVHIVGPEQGITQPGTTIVCGDSHTATHGAFGAIAFGIGTTQVRDVLATQTIAMEKLKVRRINVDGKLRPGVYAKDVILHIIRLLGAKGGIGYAYEYAGSVFDNFTMEERMTVCNMSIEGGARCGYVNPDQTTFDYLRNRPYSPGDDDWDQAVADWSAFGSDPDAEYDDLIEINAEDIEPTVTWGISPDHG
ncbi:MAG: aconitase family protein, partial [Akkermansiaceae bacterium]